MAIKEGIAPVVATPIPDNFPGRFALKDSGIDYLEDIPRDGDELVKITGIGKVTANQILTWLSA
jgi:endonuclease III